MMLLKKGKLIMHNFSGGKDLDGKNKVYFSPLLSFTFYDGWGIMLQKFVPFLPETICILFFLFQKLSNR